MKADNRLPFRRLCVDLTGRKEYCGEDFSPGDQELYLRARGSKGPGNPTVWREIGTSHHLSFVVLKESSRFANGGR